MTACREVPFGVDDSFTFPLLHSCTPSVSSMSSRTTSWQGTICHTNVCLWLIDGDHGRTGLAPGAWTWLGGRLPGSPMGTGWIQYGKSMAGNDDLFPVVSLLPLV